MAYTLNKKIRDLKPYDPIQGDYQIRLDANESFYNLPEELHTAVQDAVAHMQFNRYPDPVAREVCQQFAAYYGVDPELVTACNGSDESISVIMTSFLMRGDTVITLSDDFSMYRFYAFLAEANVIEVQKREDLTIDVDKLIETANAANAAMIIFSNPCNPTSLGLKREDVLRLIRSVNALVVLDEAYMDFWDQSLLDRVDTFDNLMILRTCSKAFGMAGIRLGFTVANKTLTDAMKAVKSPYNSNTLTQKIGAAVYGHPELMRQRTKEIVHSREALSVGMKALLEQYPTGMTLYESCTNFVYLKTALAKEIYDYLLDNSIAIRYFPSGYLRITAGSREENQAVLDMMKDFFAARQKAVTE
ncbi:MAG: histidinol-phosphate transaminase [Oscillospiraceae bacterium]|nr:histidinol-phosphate transaminase [Oscillospiraceae bacterium]